MVVEFPLHWGEMDALGHVNNARFFTWFETARIALFRRVGVATDGAAGVGPILATTQCDFLVPVRFPAVVQVGVRVSKLGTTSITFEYLVCVEGQAKPYARGSSVVVLVHYPSASKVPLSDEVRLALSTLKTARNKEFEP